MTRRAAELDAVKTVEISTDLRPAAYVQRLVLWEYATGKSRVIERLRSINLVELVVVLTVLGVLMLVIYRVRRRAGEGWATGAVILSVGTTGFVTMALSIVWLFAFQNLYGYVYQRIGWIIAVFMGGLVIGCGWVSWRSKRVTVAAALTAYFWRWLIVVDVLLALLALAVPFALPALGLLQSGPLALVLVEWCVLFMVFATGMLGGAAFALAGGLRFGVTGRAGAAAGSVVGADHAGAGRGARLWGLVLVAVFGTLTTAFLLAGMKVISVGLLLSLGRFARAG